MRGKRDGQLTFAFVTTGDFVPEDHPIRWIKPLADERLRRLSPVFKSMYSSTSRPSIPPERLLKSTLFMALSGFRSRRARQVARDASLAFGALQVSECRGATVETTASEPGLTIEWLSGSI